MQIPRQTDKLQEIKEKCFQRLDNERHNLIRRRRESSGYGTYSKRKSQQPPTDGQLVFSTLRTPLGQLTKRTKIISEQVDQELLHDIDLIDRILKDVMQDYEQSVSECDY